MARLISVNVGMPCDMIDSDGRKVLSAIIKKPVKGSVIVRRLNLEGDKQADLTVHGGENKAVYAYPSEHYKFWKKEKFLEKDLTWGAFGENFTTQGLLEKTVHIGDQFTIGSATFVVTQPRLPCFKLGIRFGTQEMIRYFLDSERTGFYLKVLKEGKVEAGDTIKRSRVNKKSQTITSVVSMAKKSE